MEKTISTAPVVDHSSASVSLFSYTVGVTSVWLVVAMTVQRAVSVIWPHKVNLWCAAGKVRFYIIGLIMFACLLNSHFLYGMALVRSANDTAIYCTPTIYPQDYNFFMRIIWPWIDSIVFSLFPFAILFVCNLVLVWKVTDSVRKARVTLASGQSDQLGSRSKKASSMTVTLIVISLTFCVLTAPLSLYFII
ncbi:probable G-protein coupled receptor 139, partial [Littorina saxatilis]|uniref:probable G-protein coupled receptor 139 n=1 Tax=Littorina saxatilis TaxID=31220 RepID=UPI0038B5AC44